MEGKKKVAVEPWPKPVAAAPVSIRFEFFHENLESLWTVCLPWHALYYTRHTLGNDGQEQVLFAFHSHVAIVRGRGLSHLIEDIAQQRIKILRAPGFSSDGDKEIEIDEICVVRADKFQRLLQEKEGRDAIDSDRAQ